MLQKSLSMKNKRRFYRKIGLALLSICLLIGLGACSAAKNRHELQTDDGYCSFSDSLGNQITLKKRPETVAVLFSSYADIWTTAGGEVRISVGESLDRGFVADNCILVDSGAGHTNIDLERLIQAKPDFVIGTADYDCQVEACRICAEYGIPAAAFRVESFSDYLAVLDVFCDITGNRDRYIQYGEEVSERIQALLTETGTEREPLNILFLRAGNGDRSVKAKNADTNFVCAMLNDLGTHNIADDVPVLLDSLSLEEIVLSDPDYIFISPMGNEEAAKRHILSMFASPGWSSLDAVKQNRFCFLEKELFHYKPNARWDEAYEVLAKIVDAESSNE